MFSAPTRKEFLFFPHQLVIPDPGFMASKVVKKTDKKPGLRAWIVEEWLFFGQYHFHKQKLIHQRACMKAFAEELQGLGWEVKYINAHDAQAQADKLPEYLLNHHGIKEVTAYRCSDDWLEKKLLRASAKWGLVITWLPNPLFIDQPQDTTSWFQGRKRFLQADYYRKQRIKLGILVDARSGEPTGGQWSYDEDNRKTYPTDSVPPSPPLIEWNKAWKEAEKYIEKQFPEAPGKSRGEWAWPVHRRDAERWLEAFVQERFALFGPYEDAIDQRFSLIHHSGLSPLINNGLISPALVLKVCLQAGKQQKIPLQSLEGLVRQILGWREFVHGVYLHAGVRQRNGNFWGFERPMPGSFYTATTGIEPVDHCIRSLLSNAYNHHIERLMILSNFMLLCEIHPHAVYRWFMEMYIDAYDWVMVPNVYGMGQFADGGVLSTKPYISSSNYVVKMSNFRADKSWTEPWDALYWRFISTNQTYFLRNPRSAMMVRQWAKKPVALQDKLLQTAEQFLFQLHKDNGVAKESRPCPSNIL
jgi:deoxyribodipyrimidine photolyase-related protein